jgi:quercetin dioxygenase-like cupin family protein
MVTTQEIKKDGKLLALVVRSLDSDKSVDFLTPNEFSLQLGVQNRAKGSYVKAHEHPPFENITIPAQEFFYVTSGKLTVDLFTEGKSYKKITISAGEMVLLNCGNSIHFDEDTRLFELKQGPYRQKENEKVQLE